MWFLSWDIWSWKVIFVITFLVLVFQCKGVRINLEYNLAMSKIPGQSGLLFNETKNYITKALYWVVPVIHHSISDFWKMLAVMSLVCLKLVFMSVILQVFRVHHWSRQRRAMLNIYEKWKEGVVLPWTAHYAIGRRTGGLLMCTNAAQKRLSFFPSPYSTHLLTICFYLFIIYNSFNRKWLDVTCGLDVGVERPCSNT